MTDEKFPLNDLCERCGVMDGITVQDGMLVCFRCQRKIKKQNKKYGRNRNERKRRTRQETS